LGHSFRAGNISNRLEKKFRIILFKNTFKKGQDIFFGFNDFNRIPFFKGVFFFLARGRIVYFRLFSNQVFGVDLFFGDLDLFSWTCESKLLDNWSFLNEIYKKGTPLLIRDVKN
jgi:hypothetical protein